MKNPEDMNDEELAKAVAVEVLGWEFVSGPHVANYWMEAKDEDGLQACNFIDDGYMISEFILSPQGREAIENNLEERGWGHRWHYCPLDQYTTAEVTPFENGEPVFHQEGDAKGVKFRSIAIAALKAVRGEG